MARKKKETVEFRFYEIPQGEEALVLCGDSWVRIYGHDETNLHFHNLMEIGICRYGVGTMQFDNEKWRYSEGAITIIPENFPHLTVSEGQEKNFWEYIFFDLRAVVAELFPNDPIYQSEVVNTLSAGAYIANDRLEKEIVGIIDTIIDEYKEKKPFYQKMIKLHLHGLVMRIMRRSEVVPLESNNSSKGTNLVQITDALEFINANFDKDIKAKELAEICNMSETHFRRVFESHINMPPMDYVNLIRVQKACDLLKKTNNPMDVVAAKCGYTTTSTFNRNFKKFLDTSPYQWKINPGNYENKLLNYRVSALKGWE